MKINLFDKTEWPLGWMSPANWHKAEFLGAFRNWREKWEPRITIWKTVTEEIGNIKDPIVISKDKLDGLKEKAEKWDDFYEKIRPTLEKAEKLEALTPVWVPRGYSSEVKIKDDDVQMYLLEDSELGENYDK